MFDKFVRDVVVQVFIVISMFIISIAIVVAVSTSDDDEIKRLNSNNKSLSQNVCNLEARNKNLTKELASEKMNTQNYKHDFEIVKLQLIHQSEKAEESNKTITAIKDILK